MLLLLLLLLSLLLLLLLILLLILLLLLLLLLSCSCPPPSLGFAQDAHGPSPAAAFANCSTWAAFGLLVLHDPIVWFPNVLGFGSACAQLFMHAKFGINVPGSSAEPEPVPEPEPEADAAEEKKKE